MGTLAGSPYTVAEELKTSDRPVIKKLYSKHGTKLLAIGLREGVVLAEHTAPGKAQLMVIKGEIDFNTETESRRYDCFETYDIPLNVKHSVVAIEDAMFLLLLDE